MRPGMCRSDFPVAGRMPSVVRETDTRLLARVRTGLADAANRYAETWRKSPADGAYLAALTALVVAGMVMRSWGVLFAKYPFWLDECSWATLLVEQPLGELLIRPIGFMAASKAIAAVFGPTETALRAIPWLAGIATTVLSPFLARRLFVTRSPRVFFVAIIATHPDAVDFAKEFKPYSLALMLHCTLLWLVLTYLDSRRMSDLLRALAVGVGAILFTQDIVFALPGALIALGVAALSAKRPKELIATCAAALTGIGLVLAQYVLMWSKLGKGESEYWGRKYDVFFVAHTSKKTHLQWFLDKYQELATLPGRESFSWYSSRVSWNLIARLGWLDRRVWATLHIVGLILLLWRWRTGRSVVLLTPLLTLSVLNWLQFWPFGAFRTNLFVLLYVAAIAATVLDRPLWPFARSSAAPAVGGVDQVGPANSPAMVDAGPGREQSPARRFDRVFPAMRWALLAFVLVPVLLFGSSWHRIPYSPIRRLAIPEIVARLVQMQGKAYKGERELVVLDALHCEPWAYYTKHNPSELKKWGGEIERRFKTVCAETDRDAVARLQEVRGTDDRVFVLTVDRIKANYERFGKILDREFAIEQRAAIGASTTRQMRWHL
jgi:hypothetical protein